MPLRASGERRRSVRRQFLPEPRTRRNDMSGHGHHTPAEIRAKLNHPIVDGDGHWVEYDPVFAEQMRKVGGDKAADGFLAAMARDPRRARS